MSRVGREQEKEFPREIRHGERTMQLEVGRKHPMLFKLTLGVWLASTLIFFYFFIFDSSKEGKKQKSGGERPSPPGPHVEESSTLPPP